MERNIRIRITAGTNDVCATAWDESGEGIMVSARMGEVDEDTAAIVFGGQFEVDKVDLGEWTLGDIIASKLGQIGV